MNEKTTKAKNLKRKIFFYAVFAVSFIYVVWRVVFTIPVSFGAFSLIIGLLLWLCESATIIETFTHFYNVEKHKTQKMPIVGEESYPDVDVMICTHNESADLLEKTINGCKFMKYPDPSKVHIYVCDDMQREEIRLLSQEMEVHYFGVPDNKYAKAGNLNYVLDKTFSPLVAIFDADMIPTNQFLLETVPYFAMNHPAKGENSEKPKTREEKEKSKPLGYVQTRQSFYNPDTLQKNLFLESHAPNEQNYFYRSVNVARSRNNSAAFAGSNTVFLREALEAVGGFATYSITEDLATSIPILEKGYTSLAVDKELAHGLSPEDAQSFIKQRQRWGRGSAQVIPTARFFKSKLSIGTKWNFFVSYLYWWTFFRRFVFLICPILVALTGIVVADVTVRQLLIVWLPYYIIYNTGLRVMSNKTTNALWSDTIDTIQFPYLIWPVIAGTMKIPERKFWVTPKEKVVGRNSSLKYAIPHIILMALSVLSVAACIYSFVVLHSEWALLVVFWLVYNLFVLSYSIIYYYGRVSDSKYEDIPVNIPITITIDGAPLAATANFISEESIYATVSHPYCMRDKDATVTIEDNGYLAQMKTRVENCNGDMGCKFVIKKITKPNKYQYLQIIYDRDHAFSDTVNLNFFRLFVLVFGGLLQSKMKKPIEKNCEKINKCNAEK